MRIATLVLLLMSAMSNADEVTVAVATNFRTALDQVAAVFENDTSHSIRVVSGSTGKLYAQIVNGAPFDVFLAADQERPSLLEASGHAVAGSRLTYANGRLALLVRDHGLLEEGLLQTLSGDAIRNFAIANPALAPYGAAAREALDALGAWDSLAGKIVLGENVGQAFIMVDTGNAEAGLVALSSVLARDGGFRSAYHVVPAEFHAPIRQDGILLVHGADNAAATEFLAFLASDVARNMMVSLGYALN